MNELVDWIANQGFAIAIASYLLIRIEQKIDKMNLLLQELCNKKNEDYGDPFGG